MIQIKKTILTLVALLAVTTGAWAQTEITTIPNGDFETWTYDGEDMPNYWNSNATGDGSMATLFGGKQLKRSTDVRPGSSGQYSCSIWSKNTMGVINIGILTSGRIHFGSATFTNKENYIYSDRDGSNTKNNVTNPCAMPFTGKPTAIKVWVKYVQGGTGYGDYATAKFSATIHGDADYVAYNLAEHDNDDNKALVVASAEQEIAYNNGEWEQLTIPFNYTDNNVVPAYILINAYTNAYPGKGKANDYLYIDDIELEYAGAASSGYTVSLKSGVKDADKWTVKVGEGQAQALPIGGLKGDGSETVTLQYTGRLKVKGVKATSEAAPAAEEPVTLATPLTIEAITDGTIKVYIDGTLSTGMKYSVNGGTKTLITTTTDIEGLKAGDKVQFYGNGTQTQAYGNGPVVSILGSGDGFKTNVYGNIMSLLDEEGFATKTDLPDAQWVFYGLFNGNTTLNDASELLLPATQLAKSCYEGMFVGCTNLIKAPALPATQLAANCYSAMFKGCSALTAAPVLPATQLVVNCYHSMFNNCMKLATVTCLATSGINQNNSTSYWLQNAGSQAEGTKTFNAVSTANWPSGFNGILEGWTRVNMDN